MHLTKIAALAAALPLILAPALATAQALPPGERNSDAWRAAYEMQGDVLNSEDQSLLLSLAWHAVAANLCEALVLDHQKFTETYAAIEHAEMARLTGDEREYFHRHLAVNFGVVVGIMLAEHAGAPGEVAKFCEGAVALARDPAEPHFFDEQALGEKG